LIGKIKNQRFLFGIVLAFFIVIFDKTGSLARTGIFLKDHNGFSFMGASYYSPYDGR